MQITRIAFYSANHYKFHNICMYMFLLHLILWKAFFKAIVWNRKTMPSFFIKPKGSWPSLVDVCNTASIALETLLHLSETVFVVITDLKHSSHRRQLLNETFIGCYLTCHRRIKRLENWRMQNLTQALIHTWKLWMMYYFPHAIFLKLQLRIKAQITKKEKKLSSV